MAVIGALILVVKCVLLLLFLACYEYLVIFHEFGFVLEDSMVARLVQLLSSLVHLSRNFRVRSGKSGVLLKSYPLSFACKYKISQISLKRLHFQPTISFIIANPTFCSKNRFCPAICMQKLSRLRPLVRRFLFLSDNKLFQHN